MEQFESVRDIPLEDPLPPYNTPIDVFDSSGNLLIRNIEYRPASPLGAVRVWSVEEKRYTSESRLFLCEPELGFVDRKKQPCFSVRNEQGRLLNCAPWTFQVISGS